MLTTIKRIIVLTIAFVGFSLSAQENTDSVSSSINLEEFVVVGERAWIEGNKAIFIPTKSEKNLSNSPASLVKRMHIPTVIVDNDRITTLYGQGVSIYINGVEASGIDLSTFWPKQALRVEYIDHPTEPQYKGAPAVLNFIMTEYEIGGITKAEAVQKVPNHGDYNISSKLVYKKMTYGVLLGGGYNRNHSTSFTGSQDYKDVYYGGEQYGIISHKSIGHSYARSENMLAAVNARYRTDKQVILHTIGVKYEHNPGSGADNKDNWHPSLFNSNASNSRNSGHSLSPQVSGSYFFSFNDRWQLNADWSYAYSHVNHYSLYNADNLESIINSTRGNTHSGTVKLAGRYMIIPNKMALWLKLNSSMDRYETEYFGSSEARNLQFRGNTDAAVAFQCIFRRNVFLSFEPGLAANYWHLFGGRYITMYDLRRTLILIGV